ncbi:hypothetical protein CDD83_1737 [Cordyceps sp. RAO-2017]|nr:hypothetical protein CDD83_1737 [Cordyceps sp. RAO-2017]
MSFSRLFSVTPSAKEVEAADVVLRNGAIYTLDEASSKVSAVAIKNGIITFVGSDSHAESFVGEKTKTIDVQGRMIMPGLIDSHMHPITGGIALVRCSLNYQSLALADVLRHVQGCIDSDSAKGDDDWVEVYHLSYSSLTEQSGDVGKAQLDELKTRRPVIIHSSDMHVVLANSRALELSNITAATPDPPGGKIVRLPGDGQPSGVLQDDAGRLVKVPPPSDEENKEAARATLKLLRQNGITTFQDAAAFESDGRAFESVRQEGGLSARAFLDLLVSAPASKDEVDDLVSATARTISGLHDNSTIGPQPTVRVQAIKAFLDGVITSPSNTGAVIEPYWRPVNGSETDWAPDKSTLRQTYWSPGILAKTLEGMFLAGIDAQLHADGDLAVRVGLDAAESFRKKHPDHDIRLGLAHNELSNRTDWPRFSQLKVDPIMSFQWAQLSQDWVPETFMAISEYRHENLEAYAEIEGAGRPIVYGSDWAIDPMDYFLALKVAVTRSGDPQNPNSAASRGAPYDGLFPGWGISRESALRAITINGARFLRADDKVGSLEKGKLADLVVLENNFFEVPDEELGRQRVLLTMVGGETVFVARGAEGLDVLPKFPNDDEQSGKLDKRTVGGFDGQALSWEGKKTAARLRRRGQCPHGKHAKH